MPCDKISHLTDVYKPATAPYHVRLKIMEHFAECPECQEQLAEVGREKAPDGIMSTILNAPAGKFNADKDVKDPAFRESLTKLSLVMLENDPNVDPGFVAYLKSLLNENKE